MAPRWSLPTWRSSTKAQARAGWLGGPLRTDRPKSKRLSVIVLTLGEDFDGVGSDRWPDSTEAMEKFTEALERIEVVVWLINLAAMCAAVVGVAYSAIAAHRREWSVVLVLSWIFSVLGIFMEVWPFGYAMF